MIMSCLVTFPLQQNWTRKCFRNQSFYLSLMKIQLTYLPNNAIVGILFSRVHFILGRMIHGNALRIPVNQKVINKLSKKHSLAHCYQQCVTVNRLPEGMSRLNDIVTITGSTHYFDNYIYNTPILLLPYLSTWDHLRITWDHLHQYQYQYLSIYLSIYLSVMSWTHDL